METGPSRYFLQTLERGLLVIKTLGGIGPRVTLSAVANHAGLSSAATRRILLTLVDLGYVSVSANEFSLTPRILELGTPVLNQIGLLQVADPHLRDLASMTSEAVSLAIRDRDEALTIEHIPTSRIMAIQVTVGSRLPLFCSSTGRVLLSGLPPEELEQYFDKLDPVPMTDRTEVDKRKLRAVVATVAAEGYALVDQEVELGLRSMSVPVRDRTGRVVAACNVSAHPSRVKVSSLRRELLPPLLKAVTELERDLQHVSPGI